MQQEKEIVIECPRMSLRRCLWPALTVFFMATTGVFIGLFVWKATVEVKEKGGFDLSGPALCSDNNITFDQNHMHLWTTYPLTPDATSISAIWQRFKGKNLFAHKMSMSDFTAFFTAKIIEIVDNTTLIYGDSTLNEAIPANTPCYVTLDSTSNIDFLTPTDE